MRVLSLLAAISLVLCLGVPFLSSPSGAFVYPVMAPRKSGDFGLRKHPVFKAVKHHSGMDLAAPQGAPIRAIDAGIVIFADPYQGYGNLVVVRHKSGMTSHYGHCEKLRATPGQKVNAGQIIATVGSTGISTGPHLHFELRKDGKAIDPAGFLPGLTSQAKG